MPPMFNPGPNPFGLPPIALAGWAPDGAPGRRGGRRGPGHAFNTAAHFGSGPSPPSPRPRQGGRARRDLTVTGEVIVCCGRTRPSWRRPAGPALAAVVLRVHSRLSAGARGGRVGGPASRAQCALEVGPVGGDARRIDDAMLVTLAAVGSPKEVAAEIVARSAGCDRVGFYTPTWWRGHPRRTGVGIGHASKENLDERRRCEQ